MSIRLGTGSVSSLVRAAGNISNSITAYNDALASAQWQNSAMTATDFQQYAKYLQGRIDTLNSSGGVTSASKALSLTNNLQTANRSFTSNEIQRQSIAIMEGGANNVDKLQTIQSLYYRAANNGDDNLAQNLRQQFDSLSQTIQLQQQQAADSAASYAKADAVAKEQGYQDAASALQHAMTSLSSDFSTGGQGQFSSKLAKTTAAIASSLGAQGVEIPKGAQANNGSVIKAALQGMYAYYQHALNIAQVTPDQSSKVQSYQQTLDNLATGSGVQFGGKSFNLSNVDQYIAQPNMYYSGTVGYSPSGQALSGLKTSSVSGYTFDQNGNPIPVYSGTDATNYGTMPQDQQNQAKNELQKAGFTVAEKDGNLVLRMSDTNNQFFQEAAKKAGLNLDPGTEVRVVPTSHGYQFMTNNFQDQNVLLSLSKDANGNFGLYQLGAKGNTLLGAMNGFDKKNNILALAQGIQSQKTNQNMNDILINAQNLATAKQTGNTAILNPGSIPGAPVSKTLVNPANAIQQPGENQQQALQRLFNGFANQKSGYTESYILPTFQKQFNLSKDQAANAVYGYRKSSGLEKVSGGSNGNAGTTAGSLPLGMPGWGSFK